MDAPGGSVRGARAGPGLPVPGRVQLAQIRDHGYAVTDADETFKSLAGMLRIEHTDDLAAAVSNDPGRRLSSPADRAGARILSERNNCERRILTKRRHRKKAP